MPIKGGTMLESGLNLILAIYRHHSSE